MFGAVINLWFSGDHFVKVTVVPSLSYLLTCLPLETQSVFKKKGQALAVIKSSLLGLRARREHHILRSLFFRAGKQWKDSAEPQGPWRLHTVDTNRAVPPSGLNLGPPSLGVGLLGVWHREFMECFDGKTCHPCLRFAPRLNSSVYFFLKLDSFYVQ